MCLTMGMCIYVGPVHAWKMLGKGIQIWRRHYPWKPLKCDCANIRPCFCIIMLDVASAYFLGHFIIASNNVVDVICGLIELDSLPSGERSTFSEKYYRYIFIHFIFFWDLYLLINCWSVKFNYALKTLPNRCLGGSKTNRRNSGFIVSFLVGRAIYLVFIPWQYWDINNCQRGQEFQERASFVCCHYENRWKVHES